MSPRAKKPNNAAYALMASSELSHRQAAVVLLFSLQKTRFQLANTDTRQHESLEEGRYLSTGTSVLLHKALLDVSAAHSS